MEIQSRNILLVDLFHVLSVVFTEHEIGDASTLGSKDLLLDATDRQHSSAERDLACHCHTFAHLAMGEGRCERCDHGDASRWAVLRCCSLRTVDVHVVIVDVILRDAQFIGMRLDVLISQSCRLLHHVAKIACQRELLALALAERRLDIEDAAAHRCPCQSCHDTVELIALILVRVKDWLAEELLKVGRCELGWHVLAYGCLPRYATHDLGKALIEQTHARLAGVLIDNLCHDLFRDGKLRVFQSMLFLLLWQQVSLGYLHFLLHNVAAELDDLHTVAKRCSDGREGVGCSDEQDLREVVVHVEVVVVEGVVLLWIEHFEQSRRRIALEVRTNLVNLIEHEHWVVCSCLDQSANDAAWERAYICLSVSAYLCLVVHSAEAHSHIFALQCSCYASAQRCLAHTRRAYQTENRSLHVATQLQHSEMFEYAVLDLLQSEVVVIQHLLRILQVQIVLRSLAPRQVGNDAQVTELRAIVGHLLVHALQLVDFLEELVHRRFWQLLGIDLLKQLVDVILRLLSQLVLDGLNLREEEVAALLFRQLLLCVLMNLVLEPCILQLTVHNDMELRHSLNNIR